MIRFGGGVITGVLAIPALLVAWLGWMDRKSDRRHALEQAAREDGSYCGEATTAPRPSVHVSGLREALDAQLTNPRAFPGRTAYQVPPRPAGVEPRVPRDRPGPGLRS